MPKGKRFPAVSKEVIKLATDNLNALPEPVRDTFKISEALEEMKKTIKNMLEKGHSSETIVTVLNDSGFKISLTKFKTEWAKLSPRSTRIKKSAKPTADSSVKSAASDEASKADLPDPTTLE